MDGVGPMVGKGITGLVAEAFDAVGPVLRGIVNAGNEALPSSLFRGSPSSCYSSVAGLSPIAEAPR